MTVYFTDFASLFNFPIGPGDAYSPSIGPALLNAAFHSVRSVKQGYRSTKLATLQNLGSFRDTICIQHV